MSVERFSTTLRGTLLTASAVIIALASPAFAQDQTQPSAAPANQSDQGSRNPDASADAHPGQTTSARGAPVTNQRATPTRGANRPTERSEAETVIDRSFDDDIDFTEVTNVKAGTNARFYRDYSAASAQARDSNGSEQASSVGGNEQGPEPRIGDVPEGTGVIVKDGKVITRTRDEEKQSTPSDRDAQASDRLASTRDPAADANTNAQTNQRREASDPRSHRPLKGTSVVNSTGQTIGSIEDIVINTESGETSLVVATNSMTGTSTVRILAPIQEVAIMGDRAVWDTTATQRELEQSAKDSSGG